MEVADGLASTPARREVRTLFDEMKHDPLMIIVEPSESLDDRGLVLYNSRPDKDRSLTDCISFITMADKQIVEALTGDHHFEQAAFVALLK